MGFKVPRKTARLVFEGDEFEGCEIVCALDITFDAQEHLEELQKANDNRKTLAYFAENCIVSWNLVDDDGKELPITGASFFNFPGWFGILVLNGWAEGVKKASGVSGPLVEPSKNGSTSEEESVMTEASSNALPNLPTPNS